MKFAAVLRNSVHDLPDTEELFTLYKQLKKSLKRIPPAHGNPAPVISTSSREDDHPDAPEQDVAGTSNPEAPPGDGQQHPAQHQDQPAALDPELEEAFVRAITEDVNVLNESYMEKEEVNVIKLGQLEENAANASTPEELQDAYRAFVDFHGDLLMVLNWSILAYTGLVKILKKHQKHTGNPVHAPHLENLLSQPFCSVEVTCDMIRSAEGQVATLAEKMGVTPPAPAALPVVGSAGPSETLTSPRNLIAPAEASPPPTEAVAGAPNAPGLAPAAAAAAAGVTNEDGRKVEGSGLVSNNNNNQQQQQPESRGVKRHAEDAPSQHAQHPQHGDKERSMDGAFAGVRRAQAALSMWEQLAHASTPSTCIAQAAGAGAGVPRMQAASDTTNSSAV